MGSPVKVKKVSDGKGSVVLLKESIQLGVVSRSPSEKVYSKESWKTGIESHRQILQGHKTTQKIYRE